MAEKEKLKSFQIGKKKEVKFSVFVDDMLLHKETLKTPHTHIKKKKKTIRNNKNSKVAGYEINIKIYFIFIH